MALVQLSLNLSLIVIFDFMLFKDKHCSEIVQFIVKDASVSSELSKF